MENGLRAEQGLVMDRDVDDVLLRAAAVLAGDGRKEMMAAEKVVEEVVEEEEEEEEEDVYSMDVSDELEKRNGFVVKRAATAIPELDMNDPPKEEDVRMTSMSMSMSMNNGSASEFETAAERGLAEIQIAATASAKEDVRDLNETPAAELENESGEVTTANEASPAPKSTPVQRDFLQAAEAPEVGQEARAQGEVAKAEVIERAVGRPTLDVNEPPEALKMAEEMHPDVAAFRIVKAEEAKSLHDVEAKMVGYIPERESFRGAVRRESEGEVVGDDLKETGRAPERTELEREMELYEASEREEQARLLGPMRVEQQREELYRESHNEKKRALDMPMPERQRKLSRNMLPGDERKREEEDVCFICFDGGELVLCDRRYGWSLWCAGEWVRVWEIWKRFLQGVISLGMRRGLALLTIGVARRVQIVSEGVSSELHWAGRGFLQEEGGVVVRYAFADLADCWQPLDDDGCMCCGVAASVGDEEGFGACEATCGRRPIFGCVVWNVW
jgi:hypothetical protein